MVVSAERSSQASICSTDTKIPTLIALITLISKYNNVYIPKTDIGDVADHLQVPIPGGCINIGPALIWIGHITHWTCI